MWEGDRDDNIIQNHKTRAARGSPNAVGISPRQTYACYTCSLPDAHPTRITISTCTWKKVLDETFGLCPNPAVTYVDFQNMESLMFRACANVFPNQSHWSCWRPGPKRGERAIAWLEVSGACALRPSRCYFAQIGYMYTLGRWRRMRYSHKTLRRTWTISSARMTASIPSECKKDSEGIDVISRAEESVHIPRRVLCENLARLQAP